MKKKLSLFLISLFLFSNFLTSNVTAQDNESSSFTSSRIVACQTRAQLFLNNAGHSSTLSNPVELYNLSNEIEAVAFSIGESGYIIVNENDFSIPELSFDKCNPFIDCTHPVYNGPLQYFSLQNGQLKSLNDDSIIDPEQFVSVYSKGRIQDIQGYFVSLMSLYQEENTRSPVVERYLTGTLQEWTALGGNCGPIACAICMRYYYDYVSTSYVDSDKISRRKLINLMKDYVGSGGSNYYDMESGLNDYFDDQGVVNTATIQLPFNFNYVKTSIRLDRPIIVGTYYHPTYGNHWIVAHGYFESRADGNYLIINDGYKNNNVWIEPNTTTLDGTISFEY